tara:strand:- start:1456 stop:1626 length:171 start_codon:yes stop_codon:yes gene_type:complete
MIECLQPNSDALILHLPLTPKNLYKITRYCLKIGVQNWNAKKDANFNARALASQAI